MQKRRKKTELLMESQRQAKVYTIFQHKRNRQQNNFFIIQNLQEVKIVLVFNIFP
jgi:hypothetical protein